MAHKARPLIRSIATVAALCAAALPALAAELSVEVKNIPSDKGNVRIGVFNSAESFPKQFFKGVVQPAQSGSMVFVFKDLPPGRYAVSAVHDQNKNDTLDRGLMGIPKEPYGFSNDARGTMGPPSFRDAAVNLKEPGAKIQFSLE